MDTSPEKTGAVHRHKESCSTLATRQGTANRDLSEPSPVPQQDGCGSDRQALARVCSGALGHRWRACPRGLSPAVWRAGLGEVGIL